MSTLNTDTIVAIVIMLVFWALIWLIAIARQSIRYVYLISYDKTCVVRETNSKVKFNHVTRGEFVTLSHRIREEDILRFRFAHGDNNVNHCEVIAISKIRIKFQRGA